MSGTQLDFWPEYTEVAPPPRADRIANRLCRPMLLRLWDAAGNSGDGSPSFHLWWRLRRHARHCPQCAWALEKYDALTAGGREGHKR